MLCPIRKKEDRSAEEPNEFELNSNRIDPDKLTMIRKRLSDASWWMQLLCQSIGTPANHEDREIGKFFQGRNKAVRILDESTLLACAAYVDLNPIRAAMVETLEESDHTSIQRRIQGLAENIETTASPIVSTSASSDSFMSPLTIDEQNDPTGTCASIAGKRCSPR